MNTTFSVEPHIQTIHAKKVSIELPLMEKLKILSDAAKYDVACTSSGVAKVNQGSGLGNAMECGICHSFSADGTGTQPVFWVWAGPHSRPRVLTFSACAHPYSHTWDLWRAAAPTFGSLRRRREDKGGMSIL